MKVSNNCREYDRMLRQLAAQKALSNLFLSPSFLSPSWEKSEPELVVHEDSKEIKENT
jgi:hypothetical protein